MITAVRKRSRTTRIASVSHTGRCAGADPARTPRCWCRPRRARTAVFLTTPNTANRREDPSVDRGRIRRSRDDVKAGETGSAWYGLIRSDQLVFTLFPLRQQRTASQGDDMSRAAPETVERADCPLPLPVPRSPAACRTESRDIYSPRRQGKPLGGVRGEAREGLRHRCGRRGMAGKARPPARADVRSATFR